MSYGVATLNSFAALEDPSEKPAAPVKVAAKAETAAPVVAAASKPTGKSAAGGAKPTGQRTGGPARSGPRDASGPRGPRGPRPDGDRKPRDAREPREPREPRDASERRPRRAKDHHESGTGRPVNEGPKKGGAGRHNVGKAVPAHAQGKTADEVIAEVEATPAEAAEGAAVEAVHEPKDNSITLDQYFASRTMSATKGNEHVGVAVDPQLKIHARGPAAQLPTPKKATTEKKAAAKPAEAKKTGAQPVRVDRVLKVTIASSEDRPSRGPRAAAGAPAARAHGAPEFNDKSFPALGSK